MDINVFLVEDHEIVRTGVKALLNTQPQIKIVGEASNGQEALEKLKKINADVLLLDMNMPVMSGLESAKRIKREYPQIKILVLSMHDHENYLIDMLEAGADGYILKDSSIEDLIYAIQKIFRGGVYIGAEFTLNMLAKYRMRSAKEDSTVVYDFKISDREMDVLKLVVKGMTNNEIALKLFTSVRTIETRRKKLLEKTKTKNTAMLIHFATANGILK
ncbi:MAG TPA: response regulator transcription factor [Bacteroidia bacterium]|jgi:DNA-binding NarL/FixJ family response regulator|nr:response regulator transcription factor [Bacteroidia bacterium]